MIYTPSIFEVQKDTNKFIENLELEWENYFDKYSRFYNISTEAIKDYIPSFNNNIDNALTVGASGDQGIALINKGAKNIYFFDINIADYYYLMLRKCALENLKRNDFIEFIIAEKKQPILNYKLYKKIEDKLPNTVKYFWDTLYKYFNYNNKAMEYYLFRSTDKHSQYSRVVNEYYSNNELYYSTQDKVKNSTWNFIASDFYKLDKVLDDDINYDAIILSNIYEYLNFGEDVSIENAKKYVKYIKEVLIPKLNTNGTIMSAYLCRYNDDVDNYIKNKLIEEPEGYVKSADLLSGLDNLEKYFTGYTGQNVSYHYLLNEFDKELPHDKVLTASTGYGMSSSRNDMALVYKKASH